MTLLILQTPEKLAVFRQYSVSLSGSLSFATLGTAFAWSSPTLPKLLSGEAPLHLDIIQASWVVSLFFLGNLISPIPSALLADKIGPHKTMLWSTLLPILSWLIVIFSTDVIGLYIARFLIGLNLGIVTTVNPIYLGEIAQPDIRGSLIALNAFASDGGMVFVFLVGPFVSYNTLAWLCLVFPLCFFFSFLFAPESPFFVMKKTGLEEAKLSLAWFRGGSSDLKLEIELDSVRKMVETKECSKGSVKEIFLPGAARKSLIIGLVYSAAKRLSGNGPIRAHSTVTLPEKTFSVLTPNGCALVLGLTTTFSALIATFLSDKFGRKTLMIVSCLGCALANLAVTVLFFLDDKSDIDLSTVEYVPFLGLLAQSFLYSIGLQNMIGQIKSEIFATHLKSKLSALCSILMALISFLLNKFYLIVADWEGLYLNYLLYSVSCFITVLFTVVYMPETRGKSLQEIQDILSKESPNSLDKETG